MGFPRARFSHRSLRRLAGWIFWLSLLGLGSSLGLAYWAHALKQRLGDHMDLALPIEGYLLPGTLGLAALLTLPCHLVGIALWPSLVKDFARRTRQSRVGGRRRVSRLLLLHAVLSCLSGWLVGGACAGGAYYFAQTRRRLGQGLRRAVRHYRDDGDVKARLDRLQVELSCCGSESFVDWFFVPWAKTDLGGGEDDDEDEETYDPENEELIEPQMQQRHLLQNQQRADSRLVPREAYVYLASTDVPYSCCLAEVLQSCEHRNLFALATLSIATEGCRDKLLRIADQAGWEIFACLAVLAIYQLTLSVLSRFLQTALSSDTMGRRPTGWIFGSEPQNSVTCRFRSHEEKECLVPDVDASRRTKSKKLCEEEESDDEKDEDEDAGDDEDSDSTISSSDDSSKGRCRGGASATVKKNGRIEHNTANRRRNGTSSKHNNIDDNKKKKRKTNDAHEAIFVTNNRATNYASSSSSASTLLPLPPIPRRPSRRPRPTQAAADALDAGCPLHNRCPVHLPAATRADCPVHGDVNFRR